MALPKLLHRHHPKTSPSGDAKVAQQQQPVTTQKVESAAPVTAGQEARARDENLPPVEGRPTQATPFTRPAQVAIDYQMVVKNGPPSPGGTKREQLRNGAASMRLSAMGAQSIATHGKSPPDFALPSKLAQLELTPPTKTEKVTLSDYTSHMRGSPDEAYEHFVNHFAEVFGAADLEVRPALNGPLTDGARVYLQDKGPPPMFVPIEVRLDPLAREVRITTLEGHPFRGTNRFQFVSDGPGQTKLVQKSAFQGSSPLIHVGVKLMGAVDRQHHIWEQVHKYMNEAMS